MTETAPVQQKLLITPEKNTPSIPVPYMFSYGIITRTLDAIIAASTPPRFTQDFLSSKLNIKGGNAKSVIPFLKKTGFLNGDGTPTELYKEFRNDSLRGLAAASALKKGFAPFYEMNEYLHEISDSEVKGIIIQATGLDSKSSTLNGILGSYKALKAYGVFDSENEKTKLENKVDSKSTSPVQSSLDNSKIPVGLKLGYVINLNLPVTTDIEVFDAIFKSLREHILE